MSNNNILNPFTGLFRSMSRRSSQRHNPDIETSASQQRGDVDMDSQQQSPVTPVGTASNTDATLSNLPADAVHDVGNESDSSMPVLQDVSDSEDSDGAVDSDDEAEGDQAMDTSEAFDVTAPNGFLPGFVGIQSNFHTHMGEDETMPPLEAVRLARPQGTRRARVEDDVDGDSERDRRHPSQRASRQPTPVSSASAIRPPEHQAGVPGVAADPLPPNPHRRPRHHHPYQPIGMNFLQMGFGGTSHVANPQPSSNRPQSNPGEAIPQGNGQQPATTRNPIATILESLLQAGGQTGAFTTTFNGAPLAPTGGDGDAATANNRFLNLLATISGLNGGTFAFNSETGGFPFFGIRQVPEREDPERAKVLVEGLEEVPLGLIRRLERISPESSGCAICWEKLLEDAAEYLRREEEEEKNKTTKEAIKTDFEEQMNPGLSADTTAGPATAASSTSSTRAKIPKYPRIVTLPCSHVFHAECLIPWFTRPHQTTCPTCRFNIDPDNLTHGIGARRRAAASVSGGDVATEAGGPVPEPTRIENSANAAGENGEFVQGFFGVVESGPEGPTFAPVDLPHSTNMRAAALGGPARNSFFPFSRDTTTLLRRTASAGESSSTPSASAPSTNASMPTSNSSPTPATNNSGTQALAGAGSNSSANASSASTAPTAPTAPVSREHLVWPSAPRAQPVLPQTFTDEQIHGLVQAFAPHPRANPTQRPRSERRTMNAATNNIPLDSGSSNAFMNNGSSATSANSNTSSSNANQNTVQLPVPPPSGAHVHFQPQARAQHRHHRHHPQPGNFVIGFDFVVTNSSPEEPENANENDDNTTPVSTGANTHEAGGIPMNVGGVEWTLEQIPFGPPGWGMQPGDSSAGAPFTLEEEQEYEVEVDQFGVPHVVNGPVQQSSNFQSHLPPPSNPRAPRAPRGSIFNPATIATDLRGPFAGAASAANPSPPAGSGVQRPGSAPRPPSVPRPPGGGRRRSGSQRPVGDNGNTSNATGDNTNAANSQPGHRAAALDLNNYINSMLSGATLPGRWTVPRQSNEGALPRGGTPSNGDSGGPVHSTGSHAAEHAPRERRAWAPPAAPGLTLRQTIEKREREAGLRCWDVSCGVGPSDEDPLVTITEEQKRQVRIRQAASASSSQEGGEVTGKGKEKEATEEQSEPIYVCDHTFHPPCVVSAQRAALNGAEEVTVENGKFVEISCPVCRASGVLSREDWEEGVRGLEAGLS